MKRRERSIEPAPSNATAFDNNNNKYKVTISPAGSCLYSRTIMNARYTTRRVFLNDIGVRSRSFVRLRGPFHQIETKVRRESKENKVIPRHLLIMVRFFSELLLSSYLLLSTDCLKAIHGLRKLLALPMSGFAGCCLLHGTCKPSVQAENVSVFDWIEQDAVVVPIQVSSSLLHNYCDWNEPF